MNLFQRYLLEEFVEEYQEKRISRRQALKLIAPIVGSIVVANSILASCVPLDEETAVVQPAVPTSEQGTAQEQTATAQPENTPGESPAAANHGTVTADDPAINASEVQFPGEQADIVGYLSRPAAGEPAPVILVCHENRGLTPHIQDVTRRFAKAGYVALAVDLLSRHGGSSSLSSSEVPGILSSIEPDVFVQDFKTGWQWLNGQDFAQVEHVGMTGFCFGGGVTWRVATQMPELKAAIPFYGPHPEQDDVANIQAAVLAIYGENDTRINQGIPAIEEAMQQNNKIYSKVIYPDSDHAFFNDTGSRYNPTAAQDAWAKMLDWFKKYL